MNSSSPVFVSRKSLLKISALVLIAGLAFARAASAADAPTAQKVDFIKDVQPIFKASCVKCHGLDPKHPMKKGAGELRLDDKTAALKGGKYGADIVPGNAKDSRLFKLLGGPVTVTVDDKDKTVPPMPKAKKGEKFKPLSDEQIATIRQWIDQGAGWPDAK